MPSARAAPATSVTWAGPELVAEVLPVLVVRRVLEEVALPVKSKPDVEVAPETNEDSEAVAPLDAVVEGALSAGLGVVAVAPVAEQQSAPPSQTLPSLQHTSPSEGR